MERASVDYIPDTTLEVADLSELLDENYLDHPSPAKKQIGFEVSFNAIGEPRDAIVLNTEELSKEKKWELKFKLRQAKNKMRQEKLTRMWSSRKSGSEIFHDDLRLDEKGRVSLLCAAGLAHKHVVSIQCFGENPPLDMLRSERSQETARRIAKILEQHLSGQEIEEEENYLPIAIMKYKLNK